MSSQISQRHDQIVFQHIVKNLLIPKPFSTVYAIAGVPIALPQGATKADLVRATRAIQSEMDRLNEIAERLAAGESLDTYGLIRQIVSDLAAAA